MVALALSQPGPFIADQNKKAINPQPLPPGISIPLPPPSITPSIPIPPPISFPNPQFGPVLTRPQPFRPFQRCPEIDQGPSYFMPWFPFPSNCSLIYVYVSWHPFPPRICYIYMCTYNYGPFSISVYYKYCRLLFYQRNWSISSDAVSASNFSLRSDASTGDSFSASTNLNDIGEGQQVSAFSNVKCSYIRRVANDIASNSLPRAYQ